MYSETLLRVLQGTGKDQTSQEGFTEDIRILIIVEINGNEP